MRILRKEEITTKNDIIFSQITPNNNLLEVVMQDLEYIGEDVSFYNLSIFFNGHQKTNEEKNNQIYKQLEKHNIVYCFLSSCYLIKIQD